MLSMRTTPQRHGGEDPRHFSDDRWGTRVSGGGECYMESRVDDVTGDRIWVRLTTAAPGSEFPTAWHREAYIAGLRRSLNTARRNEEAIAAMNQTDRDSIMKHGGPEAVANVLNELRRLDAQE